MFRALMLGMVPLAGPAPVVAATVSAVYEGTIIEGSDDLGLFSSEGSNLEGLAFTSSFVFDTQVGSRLTTPEFDSLSGGEAYGVELPLRFAGIRINGVTQEVLGSDLSSFSLTGSVRYDSVASGEGLRDGARFSTQLGLDARGSGIPSNFEVPFTLENTGDFTGSFAFIKYDDQGEPTALSAGSPLVDRLTVTIEGVSPVPLPSSGWLLGAAVALVGASSLWRRSHQHRVT